MLWSLILCLQLGIVNGFDIGVGRDHIFLWVGLNIVVVGVIPEKCEVEKSCGQCSRWLWVGPYIVVTEICCGWESYCGWSSMLLWSGPNIIMGGVIIDFGWSLLLWVGLHIFVGEAQYCCGWIFKLLRLGLKKVEVRAQGGFGRLGNCVLPRLLKFSSSPLQKFFSMKPFTSPHGCFLNLNSVETLTAE